MLRFTADKLSPVIHEARSHQCQLLLVKDHGVYFMAEKVHSVLAYAVGCHPDVDEFDQWWELSRNELGGDDFAHHFNPLEQIFSDLIEHNADLILEATSKHFHLRLDIPSSDS